MIRAMRILASSPTKFCQTLLDFHPFPYQMKMLEAPSKKIVVCAARRVGKSITMANKALWFAICHPKTSTLIVASTQRQSMLMFDKLLDMVYGSGHLQGSVVRKTRTLITFTNGSRIVALPCGRDGKTLRGEHADLIIVDEAAFVPEDVILSVMMPMLATTNGTVIMMSTPYDRSHFFFTAFNSPSWSRYRFKTEDNPLVSKEWLEQQKEMLGEKRFKQEYLAEFVDDEDTYFPMSLLRKCVHSCVGSECKFCASNAGSEIPTGELYAGYDPGGLTDPAALVVVEKAKASSNNDSYNPAFRVVYTKTFYGSEKSQVDVYTKFNVQIAEFHKVAHLKKLVVDSTGIGAPIVSNCKELGLPVEGMNLHRKNQEEIFSNLKILLEQRKVELPDNLELLSCLNCISCEPSRSGTYSFSHPSGTHDDLAYALALAVWKAGKGNITIAGSIIKSSPSYDDPHRWQKILGGWPG